MKDLKKVLAICGSTRTRSTNMNLIKAMTDLARDQFEMTIFEGLTQLPHFNPDLDGEQTPGAIISFRKTLRSYDGILICTPEYAMGVPGTLKNAIDWTVSSMEFSHKPTALVTASSLGQKGHQSLLDTLRIIEAQVTPETELVISHAQTKVSSEPIITDEKTREGIKKLLAAFFELMKGNS
jgi:NAD(P)H-dependent FMN reductase